MRKMISIMIVSVMMLSVLALTFKDDGDNIKTKILGADMIFERQ